MWVVGNVGCGQCGLWVMQSALHTGGQLELSGASGSRFGTRTCTRCVKRLSSFSRLRSSPTATCADRCHAIAATPVGLPDALYPPLSLPCDPDAALTTVPEAGACRLRASVTCARNSLTMLGLRAMLPLAGPRSAPYTRELTDIAAGGGAQAPATRQPPGTALGRMSVRTCGFVSTNYN